MRPRILVIEDNVTNLELVRYLLAANGCDITPALNGLTGLRMLEKERFDLVLCDIAMSGMDGYEVLQHVRANPALVDLPVVAVTAFAMEDDRNRILKAGFDGCLTKPISPGTFAQDVLRYLKTHGESLGRRQWPRS